ncbi:MAG TPA: protoporphyrinogen oxidase [Bacteroidota bacterium]|nr:protoporphyrinogen oxidase [Bacteroidota bacterium]
MTGTEKHIVVVGGGISGLCAAYFLKKRGFRVTLFEKDATTGGTMKTILQHEWLIESGPNSALETTPLLRQICGELGILDQWVYADERSSKRYILRNGSLHPLPMGLGSFLSTPLWTIGGKLRLLKEPFIGRARKEESVAEFVTRRLGKEFLDYAINPFVAGVYAGSPEKLSVQSAFPKLYALEEKYGGLIRGTIRSRGERKRRKETAKDRAKLFSFTRGMQTLPESLTRALGDAVQLSISVERITPMRAGERPQYFITTVRSSEKSTVEADAVVLSVPSFGAAPIIRPIDPETAASLDEVYYPPVAEVFLGYRREQIDHPLDGFGFLVPEVEGKNILGCLWSSSLFPHRAPESHVALTTFVGGSRRPDLVGADDSAMLETVLSELSETIGIRGNPDVVRIIRWDRAIPQYNVGYHRILSKLERFEQNFRGSFVCSNYRGGIAVGDCVMNAEKTAATVANYFGVSPG